MAKDEAIVTDTKPDLTKLNQWLAYGQGVAKRKQWDYFVIDQFLRGNQDIKGNPQDNTITITPRTDKISYPINKLYTTFRAVRAFVTRHKPVVEIDLDEGSDEAAKTYARRANKLIARDNKLNNSRKINKEWVYYGIKYGLGWRQVGYDPDKHVCIRWSVDPNDIVLGAPDGQVEDAPYLIKSVKRTVGYVRSKYKKSKDIVPDGKMATNEYKELSFQIQNLTGFSQKQTEAEDTVMLHECWYRLFEENSKGGLINKVVFTENEILGEIEETPYDEYPFIPYFSEITPNEIAGDGHLKHVIPAQRMLNLLNTQMLEYNHIVNKGRFLVINNSGFRVINAKEGQIIKYNQGKRPEVLNPPVISGMLDRQMNLAITFIEDLGGQHDASMGSTPERLTSGAAIEALQLGDSNNISDLRDNFEDALALEAAWILKMYSLFEADGVKLVETVGKEEKPFVAMGKVALEKAGKTAPERYYMEDNGAYCDTCTILSDNKVKASVTSQLGETKQARLELLFKLLDAQVISGKSVLRHLEFPNTQDIMQELAEEELAAVAIEQMKAPPAVPGGMPAGAPGGMPAEPMPPEGEVPMPPDDQMMSGMEALKGKLQQMQQEAV